jgi:AAA15 family ATPase/GTPase
MREKYKPTTMFDTLSISHFRAFEHLDINPLARVNLIVGGNDIGKTGVLEAVFLANLPSIEELKTFPFLFRRVQEKEQTWEKDNYENFWMWLFHEKDFSQAWEVSLAIADKVNKTWGQIENNHEQKLKITGELNATTEVQDGEPPMSSEDYMSNYVRIKTIGKGTNLTAISAHHSEPMEDAELVNQLSVQNNEEELISYLRFIEPNLRKLKYLRLPGHNFPYVYADVGFGKGRELIPTTQLGQVFSRMLNLFASIMVKQSQILLIDEFENGLHHNALVPIWTALGTIARERDIQIFATTHSMETIQAAHTAFGASKSYDFDVIKLRKDKNGKAVAFILGKDEIDVAIETNFEIR